MKALNGEGICEAINIQFDLDDPVQARAWEVARRKALPHGQRKHLIIAFFNAIDEYERLTGKEINADQISGHSLGMAFSGKFWGASVPQEPQAIEPDEPIVALAQKKSGQETAKQFLAGMGNLFG
jgi:hypothetical protein